MAESPETWSESTSEPPARLRVLLLALSYDALDEDRAVGIPIEAARRPLRILRGDEGGTPQLTKEGLVLPDKWLSGHHATLERAGGDDVLVDAGSRNGTWVNGRRVERHRLTDGDALELGHTLFVYRELDEEAWRTLQAAPRFGPTRTQSVQQAQLASSLLRLAPSRQSVLILAETGAGKEVAAAALHAQSGRTGPLVAIDCGAIPETLFESTFFGHKKGAFTGATEARAGELQRASGGTIFLDELGNLSAAGQQRLLRVIEEGKIVPVGGGQPIPVDLRWVAATNRDLTRRDETQPFREDLLQRLAGYVARIVPLRERREDLGILTAHLLAEQGAGKVAITAAAARRLFLGELRGNVRQLKQALATAVLLAAGKPIEPAHLPSAEPQLDEGTPAAGVVLPERKGARPAPTREELEGILESTGGNVVRTADALQTSARQLYRWLERYDLDLEKYRNK